MYLRKKTQLFLLHFAGGNCYSFNFLREGLEHRFDFQPLELPGRGRRGEEPLLHTKAAAIKDYCQQIMKLRNQQPYLIYGHSMGATLSLSVAQHMEHVKDPPQSLIVSGNPGPGVERKRKDRHLMEDTAFKEELRRLGGVPEALFQNEELFDFFNPIIRADFEILEKDNFSEKGTLLKTPIYAMMGDQEETANHIDNWQHFTSGAFQAKIFSGHHFFIHDYPREITEIIKRSIHRGLIFAD